MGEKDAQLLRTYWMATITAILLLVGGYFGYQILAQEEKTLANDLTPLGYLGERIEHDLNSEPLLEVSEDLSIADTLRDGIQIEYPKQNSNLKNQNDNEESQNETTFTTDDEQETLSLNFPKDLSEPMHITLPGGSFTVTHDTNQDYSVELLTNGNPLEAIRYELIPGEDQATEEKQNYVRYTSADERKSIYYAYQKDTAEGYRNLKHWTLYNHGIGIESESYTFTNVTLKINDRGEVEGRFLTPFGNEQDSINNTQNVDEDLWARAQRVIAQDLEQSTPPDFIIPPPYYLDQYGRQTTLEWALNNNKDTISVAFNPLPGEYPVALDPTLQFTAPGVSNSGDYIDGESGNFGEAVIVGDFNADGKNDLAVGAYQYNASQGRVYIFYGSDMDSLQAQQANVILTGESSSWFGESLTVADWNSDGKDDLAVGGSGYNSVQGRTYIFYGGGMTSEGAASADIIYTGQSDGSNSFGAVLASGDFNSDGKDDLAVGGEWYDSLKGRAYVFYGGSMSSDSATSADVIYTGENFTDYFAASMDVGDYNADGTHDLVVGAWSTSVDTGTAYIFYGGSMISGSATTADVTLTGESNNSKFGWEFETADFDGDGDDDLAVSGREYNSDQGRVYIFNGGSIVTKSATSSDVTLTGEATANEFGYAMTSSDLNNDGTVDLVVSGRRYGSYQGRLYIFHGGALSSQGAGDASVIITGENTGDSFAHSLASADLNGDGKADIIVGARAYNTNVGRSYIFYSQSGQVNLNDHITGEGTSDYFGSAFAVGDFNSDGRDDLAVGAYADNSYTGKVYIFYNDGDYPSLASTSDVEITGQGSSDSFGWDLVAGDLDGDGDDDLAVSANQDASWDGKVYVFYNDGSYPSSAGSADHTITGTSSSEFGNSLAVGDIDGDGSQDLVVGARLYDPPVVDVNRGAVFLFYNDGSLPSSADTADVRIEGTDNAEYVGWDVAVGDMDGDGDDDVVTGANDSAYIIYNDGSYPATTTSADVAIDASGGGTFGEYVHVADLDGDGDDDLLVSDESYDDPGVSNVGRVYVFYNDGAYPLNRNGAEEIITGEFIAGTWFGGAMMTGDYNNDGALDIAVGAHPTNTSQGRAYVFFNSKRSAHPYFASVDDRNDLYSLVYGGDVYDGYASTSDITIIGDSANDDFGFAFVTGDFNADGKDDLVVGAPGYDNGADTGRVYFYETREDYAWEIQRQSLSDGLRVDPIMGYEMKITGESVGDTLGDAAIVIDLNNDGKEDLVVGASRYNTDTGRVYIFYNDGSYPTRPGKADVIIEGEGTLNRFGYSFTTGDYNTDGLADLVVGAWDYSGETGRAYIYYGGSLSGTLSASADADVILTGEGGNDNFSISLTTGDWDADGKDDLAAGANAYISGTGRTYIFYNSTLSGSITASADADVTITNGGNALTTGDFNADGTDDLVVGDNNVAYVFYSDTLSGSPTSSAAADVTLTGGTGFGGTLITGDWNADGTDDLAVSAYAVNDNDGQAYIFYGGSMISEASSGADVTVSGDGSRQFIGTSLTAGDFNADGRDDLAVGGVRHNGYQGISYIFYQDVLSGSVTAADAGATLTGEAIVDYYGQSVTAGDLNNDGIDDLMVGATGYNSSQGHLYFYTTNDRHITGEGTNGLFGSSLAVGDYNNDGKNDLAVGAKGYSSNQGRAYVFFGGRKATTSVSGADVVLDAETAGDYFGIALASGDYNADGIDDLAVAASNYNSDQGRTYIFYGGSMVSEDATGADVTLTGETTDNKFGNTLATGDINGDDIDDVIVGANEYNNSWQGRTYIFYGGSMISEGASGADVVLTGETSNDYFSTSFGVADFNHDGVDDLAVGSTGHNSWQGRVYIFYSTSTPSSRNASAADIILTGETTSDQFGRALTSGDYNQDGTDDLVVGASNYNSNQGRAYIFYGGSLASENASQADLQLTGEATGQTFAFTLAAGDWNMDGVDDLAAGAYLYNSLQGRTYLFYGDQLTTAGAESANVIITGEDISNLFGYTVSGGDMNGNGVDDLIIGAQGFDDPDDQGRIYIIMSEASAEHKSSYKIRGDVKIRGTVKFH